MKGITVLSVICITVAIALPSFADEWERTRQNQVDIQRQEEQATIQQERVRQEVERQRLEDDLAVEGSNASSEKGYERQEYRCQRLLQALVSD